MSCAIIKQRHHSCRTFYFNVFAETRTMHFPTKEKPTISTIGVMLGLLLGVHFIAVATDAYREIIWIDIPIHLLGGLIMGSAFLWYARRWLPKIRHESKRMVFILLLLGWTALLGVSFEFFEFSYDHLIATPYGWQKAQLGNADTMKDLLDDLLGGLLVLVIF
ncbi:MAG: hypothetical protein A3C12_00060 [Candidatus Sungbacteria bacterium RIFCSPHIGHO2_02_FULL_49_20]|uniref:Uncharacterized protein n=1 Tax=Candidatus Sungbacteria bacterium RIFCSPHIGHO2_02_FULL_49_20 TaxID=1802272 RepID=A0A1G2KRT1_9BACT|nr:MAG: hypothetical protein A3C12_00060 [Candidatus Sungbacteria bacterium RIFCSPHIGHO2_02_FULL_49_20]